MTYHLRFGNGNAPIIDVVIVVVTVISPIFRILQRLLPHLQVVLCRFDIESVLFELLQTLLRLICPPLSCFTCRLCLVSLLLLTSDGFYSIVCALAVQGVFYLGYCACAQFVGHAENILMGRL